jgi:DNA-binding GntR family transcriptional regulator
MPTKKEDAEAQRRAKQLAPIPVRGLPAEEIDLPKRVIAREIARRAKAGVFKPGDTAPSISDLMTMSGAAKNTVRSAMDLLRDAGMIRTITGMGSFFAPKDQWQDLPGE